MAGGPRSSAGPGAAAGAGRCRRHGHTRATANGRRPPPSRRRCRPGPSPRGQIVAAEPASAARDKVGAVGRTIATGQGTNRLRVRWWQSMSGSNALIAPPAAQMGSCRDLPKRIARGERAMGGREGIRHRPGRCDCAPRDGVARRAAGQHIAEDGVIAAWSYETGRAAPDPATARRTNAGCRRGYGATPTKPVRRRAFTCATMRTPSTTTPRARQGASCPMAGHLRRLYCGRSVAPKAMARKMIQPITVQPRKMFSTVTVPRFTTPRRCAMIDGRKYTIIPSSQTTTTAPPTEHHPHCGTGPVRRTALGAGSTRVRALARCGCAEETWVADRRRARETTAPDAAATDANRLPAAGTGQASAERLGGGGPRPMSPLAQAMRSSGTEPPRRSAQPACGLVRGRMGQPTSLRRHRAHAKGQGGAGREGGSWQDDRP